MLHVSLLCCKENSCGYPVYSDVLCYLALCDTLWRIRYTKKRKERKKVAANTNKILFQAVAKANEISHIEMPIFSPYFILLLLIH